MSKYRDAMTANMRQWLKPPLPGPVVDLGGRGHRAWMASIIGGDFETWDMQAGQDVTRVVDATHMPGIPEASVGAIVCTSTLEHIDKPWAASAHMARITRPGGLLYICAPFEFNYHPCPEDYWRFTPAALRILFGTAFEEIACDWVSKLASFFVGRRRPVGGEDEALRVADLIPGLATEAELRFLYRQAVSAPEGGELVELGTFKGKSLSVLCHAAGRRGQIPWSIDDYSYMVACSPQLVGKHLRAYGLSARVIEGDSREVPAGFERVSFLFVDTHHVAAQITAEMAAWAPLVISGGIVVCHDYEHTKWHEMKTAIDSLFADGWERLGQECSMIAFRKR